MLCECVPFRTHINSDTGLLVLRSRPFGKSWDFYSSIYSTKTNIEYFDGVLMGMMGDCRGDPEVFEWSLIRWLCPTSLRHLALAPGGMMPGLLI
jgi:hypothetical protein